MCRAIGVDVLICWEFARAPDLTAFVLPSVLRVICRGEIKGHTGMIYFIPWHKIMCRLLTRMDDRFTRQSRVPRVYSWVSECVGFNVPLVYSWKITKWNSTGCRRRLCLRQLWPWPLTFWPPNSTSTSVNGSTSVTKIGRNSLHWFLR